MESNVKEAVLRFLEGENEGVEIRVTPPRELTIGRSEECDIFLGEKKVSRKHTKLMVMAGGVRVADLQSTNGTYLNSKKVSDSAVQNNDKVKVGNSVIQVSLVYGAADAAEEAPKEPSMPKPKPSPKVETVSKTMPRPPASKPEVKVADSDDGVDLLSHAESSGISDMDEVASQDYDSKHEVSRFDAKGQPKPLSGSLSAMGLADLLQNFGQNKKSGVLKLSSQRAGKIWMVDGRVVGAEVGGAHGQKALFRMLGWNTGEFALSPLPPDFSEDEVDERISDSVESLLMEGFRQFDELEKLKKGLPPTTSHLVLKPKFTAPLSKLHPRVLDILQIILNEGTFEAILDKSPLSDLETSKIVFYLIKKEYLTAR